MLRRIAEFTIDHAWTLIAVCAAATLLLGSRVPNLKVSDTVEHFFLEDDPNLERYNSYLDKFQSDEFFLVAFQTGDAYSDRTLGLVRALAGRLAEIDNVEDVTSLADVPDIVTDGDAIVVEPLIPEGARVSEQERGRLHERAMRNPLIVGNVVSEDAKTVALFVRTKRIENDSVYRKVLTADVRTVLKEVVPDDITVWAAGGPIFYTVYMEHVNEDLVRFFPLSLLILAVVMYAIYRRWRSVWLPMVCIVSALISALGLLELSGRDVTLVTTIVPPLLTVIGVAVIVHVLNRYDEEYFRTGDSRESLIHALVHLYTPCLLTSLTTAIGFASLGLSRIAPVRETGLLAATGVMLTFLVSMTLAPAILTKLRPPRLELKQTVRSGWIGALLEWTSRVARDHKAVVLSVSAAITLAGVYGMTRLVVETNLIEYFHENSEIRRAYDFLQSNISGANSFEVLIEGDGSDSIVEPAVLRGIERTQRHLEEKPYITSTQSMADLVKMMNRAFHDGDPAYYRIPDTREEVAQLLLLLSMSDERGGLDWFTDESYSYTRISSRMTTIPSPTLRAMIADVERFMDGVFPDDVRADVTGEVPLYVAMERILVDGQLESFSLALVVIVLCVMAFFGSVRIGLYSLFPNVAPIVMTLGLMGLAGIPINLATCMIPSIAIGIAVDDTIHLLSRFRGEYRARNFDDLPGALHTTLTTTGRAMVVTSIVLFAGFVILVTSNFVPNAYFGLLTALTMIWALAADLFTAPALIAWLKPKQF